LTDSLMIENDLIRL